MRAWSDPPSRSRSRDARNTHNHGQLFVKEQSIDGGLPVTIESSAGWGPAELVSVGGTVSFQAMSFSGGACPVLTT
jgi:hypothetical protein